VKTLQELLRGPRPWHLLLGPLVPLLGMLKNKTEIWSPDVLLGPALAATAVAVLLWLLLLPFVHDPLRAALAVTFSMVATLSYVSLLRLTLSLGVPRFAPAVFLSVLLAAVVFARSQRPALTLTVFANRLLLITVLLLGAPIGWSEVTRAEAAVEPLHVTPASLAVPPPDVYVLILDGYGRADVLRDLYGFDNPLPGTLRANGFFVADAATANYAQTALSLASAFNLDYLPQLGQGRRSDTDSRRGLADLIVGSRFFRAFADAGYRLRVYESEYSMIRPPGGSDRRRASYHLNDFGYTVFETTAVPALFQAAGLPRGWLPLQVHRHHLEWTLADLAENLPTVDAKPTFVFAHLLAPHPPFAVDAEGNLRNTRAPALIHDGNMWRTIAQHSGDSYRAGYVDAVRYLNDRVTRVVRAIADRPSRPALVLIHSDHGPGLEVEWEDPGATNMRERMGVLLAVRFPQGGAPGFGEAATLVNAYRSVINGALKLQLPSLEDRSYFSTRSRPFEYIDVTDRARCRGCTNGQPDTRTVSIPPSTF
jgi:Sulfatase